MVDVRTRREQLDLSQEHLAQAVGVAVSTVRRWEAGMEPRERMRRRLARVLAVRAEDLTFGGMSGRSEYGTHAPSDHLKQDP